MRDILLTVIVPGICLDSTSPTFRRHFVIHLARLLLSAELHMGFWQSASLFTNRGHRDNSRLLVLKGGEKISYHQRVDLVAVPVGYVRGFPVCLPSIRMRLWIDLYMFRRFW